MGTHLLLDEPRGEQFCGRWSELGSNTQPSAFQSNALNIRLGRLSIYAAKRKRITGHSQCPITAFECLDKHAHLRRLQIICGMKNISVIKQIKADLTVKMAARTKTH